MPSFLHEAFVFLFRNHPGLAPELLRRTKLLPLPRFSSAHVESIEFSEIVPAEYRADLVVLLKKKDRPVYCLLVEVQLGKDSRKRETWPFYQASARARFRCPAAVLVLSPSPAVARWASRPVEVGGGHLWAPLVLGPAAIPVVDDPSLTKKFPELGVLSVMAHGRGDPAQALRVAEAALLALDQLPDDEIRMLYSDLIDSHLGELARKAFTMLPLGYQYQSKFGNRRFAEGLLEGKAEGKVEGERLVLEKQLTLKFGPLSGESRARLDQASEEELSRWAERILSASSLDEIFTEKR